MRVGSERLEHRDYLPVLELCLVSLANDRGRAKEFEEVSGIDVKRGHYLMVLFIEDPFNKKHELRLVKVVKEARLLLKLIKIHLPSLSRFVGIMLYEALAELFHKEHIQVRCQLIDSVRVDITFGMLIKAIL